MHNYIFYKLIKLTILKIQYSIIIAINVSGLIMMLVRFSIYFAIVYDQILSFSIIINIIVRFGVS
jgi:hypothetical protein